MKGIIKLGICAMALATALSAQEGDPAAGDVIVLQNGDRMTGTVVSFADGVVVLESAQLAGTVKVPIASIQNMTTANPVKLVNAEGEEFNRRISGLQNGAITLAGEGPAVAPIPVDTLAAINPPELDTRWTGTINVGGFFFSGNTDRRGANAGAQATRRTEMDRIRANANWDFAEDRQSGTATGWNLTQRRLSGGLQYDYFLSDVSYIWASTRLLGDSFADIELRATIGTGYGHQWVERDDLSFLTEVGVSYVSENFRSAAPDSEYLAARAAYDLMVQLSEGVTLLQSVQAFPSLENSDDVLVNGSTSLQMSLTEAMFAQLQWQIDYDNSPSPGLERTDHRVFASLGWTF